MWRALFLALGLYLMIAGAECLAVDRVVWRGGAEPAPAAFPFGNTAPKKDVVPEPWIPWCLLSSGAVVCLYSFTIPKRIGAESSAAVSRCGRACLGRHYWFVGAYVRRFIFWRLSRLLDGLCFPALFPCFRRFPQSRIRVEPR